MLIYNLYTKQWSHLMFRSPHKLHLLWSFHLKAILSKTCTGWTPVVWISFGRHDKKQPFLVFLFFYFFVNFYTEHIVLNVFVLTLPSSLQPQGSGPKWWMWPRKTKWKHWPWSTTMLILFSTLLGTIVPVCFCIYSCWWCQKTNNYSTQNILVHIDVYLCEFITNSNWVQLQAYLLALTSILITSIFVCPSAWLLF